MVFSIREMVIMVPAIFRYDMEYAGDRSMGWGLQYKGGCITLGTTSE